MTLPNSVHINGDSRNIIELWKHSEPGDKYPHIEINNLEEFRFSLELDEQKTWGNKHSLTSDYQGIDVRKYKLSNVHFSDEMYNDISTNSFKWMLYIKEKPKNNKIYYLLDKKSLDFYHQPKLTEEYSTGWSDHFNTNIIVSNTQVIDQSNDFVLVNRPDLYVNSFAIYCNKTGHVKGKKNYMCGKVGHIPSAYFYDINNNLVKANMYIQANWLVIEIPESLLNWDYTFPLVLDPTFGYTTAGASSGSLSIGRIISGQFTASESGTVTSITAYGVAPYSTAAKIICGVYNDNSGTPQNLQQTNSNETTMTYNVADWWVNTLQNSVSITATNWWLAVINKNTGSDDAFINYDSSGTSRVAYNGSYTALPSTYPSTTAGTRKYSLYATYTAGGGSTSNIKKRNQVSLANIKKRNTVAIANIKKDDLVTK